MMNLFDGLIFTAETVLYAIRERLRPRCRKVVFRAIVVGMPIKARCGDPSLWDCETGYCREHCACSACGCGAAVGEHVGEVVYDATAGRS